MSKLGSFKLTYDFSVPPERVYRAWLSGGEHGRMIGSKATVDAKVGGKHTAWDGYIWGKTLALTPSKRIVQSWRTTEFADKDADSKLDLRLAKTKDGCRLTLSHSNIPAGQAASYRSGWVEHYFEPMTKYFAAAASKAKAGSKTSRR